MSRKFTVCCLIVIVVFLLQGCAGTGYKFKKLKTPSFVEDAALKKSSSKWRETQKLLATKTTDEKSPYIEVVNKIVEVDAKSGLMFPQISPNAEFVVYSAYDAEDNGISIYRQEVNSTARIRITQGPYFDLYPTVSPDGKYIYFSSNRGGHFSIWRIGQQGEGGLTRITNHRNSDFAPDISRDGEQIVFHSYSPESERPEIWTCRIDGTFMTQMRPGWWPKWSNSGNEIMYLLPGKDNKIRNVWAMDVKGSQTMQLTNNRLVHSATWAINDQVLYSAFNQDAVKGNYDLYLGYKQLTTNPSEDMYPMFDNQGCLYFLSVRGHHIGYWMTHPQNLD